MPCLYLLGRAFYFLGGCLSSKLPGCGRNTKIVLKGYQIRKQLHRHSL